MLDLVTAIFLTLLGSAIYHLIPAALVRLRMAYVAAVSFAIVLAYHPLAALGALAMGVLAWCLLLAGRRWQPMAKFGPFVLILVLAAFSVRNLEISTSPFDSTLVQFGMSFYVLRLYLALRVALQRREQVSLEEMLAIALFYPIFAAGPICAREAFSQSANAARPLHQNYTAGLLRIGLGVLALYFATGVLDEVLAGFMLDADGVTDWAAMGAGTSYAVMLLKFMRLYADFAGYTQIAIGLGLFYGFDVPENFRYPFLATNIQKFWQRWHLSLSRFITNQIYLPLMLSLRRPRLSMFLAFCLVGLWHQVTPQYFLWGVGHGAMLAAYMTFSRSRLYAKMNETINARLVTAASWLFTMSAVSFLSTFANEPSWKQSLNFTLSLVGAGAGP